MAVLKCSGSPSRSTSQSSTCASISVSAGLEDQIIPCAPSPADTSSARIDGGDTLAGNHANHPGACQCMMPGSTTSSRSRMSASNGSGLLGRGGRELRADLARLHGGRDRQLAHPLHVGRHPLHDLVAAAAELVGGHVRRAATRPEGSQAVACNVANQRGTMCSEFTGRSSDEGSGNGAGDGRADRGGRRGERAGAGDAGGPRPGAGRGPRRVGRVRRAGGRARRHHRRGC